MVLHKHLMVPHGPCLSQAVQRPLCQEKKSNMECSTMLLLLLLLYYGSVKVGACLLAPPSGGFS